MPAEPEPIPHNRWLIRPEYADAVLDVLGSRHVGQGIEVELLEDEMAKRFRPGGACAVVSSGTAAIYLALQSLGLGMVKIPTYACSALANAVELLGHLPRIGIVDCDSVTLNSPAADVFVHTYGVPGYNRTDPILGWVEDFTHAPGAVVLGRTSQPCGSIGTLSVISFGATKPLGVGQGGAVLGPTKAIEEIRDIRDYDGSKHPCAFNWQLGDVYAAMVHARLRFLDEENQWRATTALRYDDAKCQHVASPRVWYRYVIRVSDWREAQKHFDRYGVETINPLRPEELIHRRFLSVGSFPNAEAAAETTLSLPIWPGMTEGQVERVAQALEELK